ncbi:uncharacterized protein LOC135355709 [Latimeria chalumnae]|uniref:uncharacterized protein LOC135355709 n=1 Tax=Latimeria chalumnae TaxID=7897 RepID=UPI00313D21D1
MGGLDALSLRDRGLWGLPLLLSSGGTLPNQVKGLPRGGNLLDPGTPSHRFDTRSEHSANPPSLLPLVSSDLPTGGRLSAFLPAWEAITTDQWVLEVIRSGYAIQFKESLPDSSPSLPRLSDSAKAPDQVVALELELASRAVEPVPEDQEGTGFYSRYFLIPKKSGGFRPILDLRRLNQSLRVEKFRMVSLGNLIPSLSHGDWYCALDLKDAYTHVAIRPSIPQKVPEILSQWASLSIQGAAVWSCHSTQSFYKGTICGCRPPCQQGIFVYPYLDYWLIRGNSEEEVARSLSTTIHLLSTLGFILNLKKSQLHPVQNITFIGAVLDAVQGKAFLLEERVSSIRDRIAVFNAQRTVPARFFLRLLGLIASSVAVTP